MFPINEEQTKRQVKAIQEVLGVSHYGVDVWFCSQGKIRALNAEWRGIKRSTDILSFPVNDVRSSTNAIVSGL